MPSGEYRYAGFFQSTRKDWTELSVVEELVTSLNREGLESLRDPRAFSPDPPDIVCIGSSGQQVAIEVVEAVSEVAVKRNAQGQKVTKLWEPGEFIAHVRGLVALKDGKTFHGGPYQRMILCVHTDEPVMRPEDVRSALKVEPTLELRQLNAAYLLFSYDPRTQTYPVLKLPVAT